MTDQDLLNKVAALRNQGLTPKQIARSLGCRPSDIAPLVRAHAETQPKVEAALVGCWVSPGWRDGLDWQGHDDWGKPTGRKKDPVLVQVLVAREKSLGPITWCGYLVDTGCLGVKNTVGPKKTDRYELDRIVAYYFRAYDGVAEPASIELAQHLVLGAVDFARGIGFEPHPDFAACREHLGAWTGPSAIRFAAKGKPYYVSGPDDDVDHIMETLRRNVGDGKFDFLAAIG
jgi:hypothetical protein